MIFEKGSPLTTTDRRYWRRRVNFRVRKARRVRTLLRWSGIAALNLVLLALLVFSVSRAVRHLTTSPEFSLCSIQVEGARRCTAAEIRGRLAHLEGSNLLDLDLQEIAALIVEEPWVRDCSVKRILPQTLRVQVSEREPSALAMIRGSAHVVDRSGVVVCPAGPDLGENLPIFTGLDRLAEPGVALERGVAALESLRRTAAVWTDSLAEIDLSRPDRLEVSTTDPGPRVLLDPVRVERNLVDYLALKDEIEDRIGPTEYVDLRWRDRIAIMPEVQTARETDPGQGQENS